MQVQILIDRTKEKKQQNNKILENEIFAIEKKAFNRIRTNYHDLSFFPPQFTYMIYFINYIHHRLQQNDPIYDAFEENDLICHFFAPSTESARMNG